MSSKKSTSSSKSTHLKNSPSSGFSPEPFFL
jgi:hypothetical protein